MLAVLCYGHLEARSPLGHTTSTDAAKRFPKPTPSAQALLDEGKQLRTQGHFSEAAKTLQRAVRIANTEGNSYLEAKSLFALGGCQIRLFQYGPAMANLDRARQLAEVNQKDETLLGGIYGNIAVVYSQLGDFPSAERAASKMVSYLRQSPRRDYFIMSLNTLGEIELGLHRVTEGRRTLELAIATAANENQPGLEATFSDNLGIWLVLNGDLDAADRLLKRALALRQKLANGSELAISYEHLAELEQKRGGVSLPAALEHIDKALNSRSQQLQNNPHYYPLHVRGLIYQGLGKSDLALADFRRAVTEADTWRQSALPGDATNTRTVAQLTAVYQDFADLAAETSLRTHNQALAEDAFEVLARNRAASLREQLTQAHRSRLLESPEYFSLLTQLQAEQASVTLASAQEKTDDNRKKLDQLRADLSDLENRLGLDQQNINRLSEKNRHRNSLRSIQFRLGSAEALLSFSLGNSHSYLWTVTSTDLKLSQLPDRRTLGEQARLFHDATQAASTAASARLQAGRTLARSLFGSIGPPAAKKPEWLIAADGDLLDRVPFASLPFGTDGGLETPLIAQHSVRILPGALLPDEGLHPAPHHRFLGIGDPIYNRADPRWERASSSSFSPRRTVASLPGSKKELLYSSQASGIPQVELLTGRDASSTRLRAATASLPEILHFAVHVLSPDKRPGEAALALSLTKDGVPELLTAESVATYRVPGSLIVLSGCASQQGEVVAGAGLVGLSRSWLLAGAEAVIVSAWPTPDDSGSFFSQFYSYFRVLSGPLPHRAAIALQKTQLDIQRAGGYRGDPSFWAAYSLISKE